MKSKGSIPCGTGGKPAGNPEGRKSSPVRQSRQDSLLLLLVVLWLLASLTGFRALARYARTPGPVGPEVSYWPGNTQLVPSSGAFTLLYFVHPQCPCTQAGLGELEQLLANTQGQLTAQVVFYRPLQEADGWSKTGLWRRAEGIPGITVRVDAGGEEARRFGVFTSGETLLYDHRGLLRFRGGITAARGHSGDNPGRASLQNYLRTGVLELSQTPVFGCSLSEVN